MPVSMACLRTYFGQARVGVVGVRTHSALRIRAMSEVAGYCSNRRTLRSLFWLRHRRRNPPVEVPFSSFRSTINVVDNIEQ